MNLHQDICQLLKDIGQGTMMSTAYDTAWVARLGGEMGEQALDWLREHQLADGGWGTRHITYHHDRVICTLAAMTALAQRGHATNDHIRWQRALAMLEAAITGLHSDPAATVGFEMIVPTLLAEAQALGITLRGNSILHRLVSSRTAKLSTLPGQLINRFVTMAHSAEMAGSDGLQLLDVQNLQEVNGSIAYSPSATAFFVLNVQAGNQAATKYLAGIIDNNGGVPNVAPFDMFERGWTLWNLAIIAHLDDDVLAMCQPHLDFMEKAWRPMKGIGFAAGYTPTDGDDTGMVYETLARFGRAPDLAAVLSYEESDHYRCFALEANPSISANIHILGALQQAGLSIQHGPFRKIIEFLRRTQTARLFWFDKWHASPYYTTAHAIITLAGCDADTINDAAYWILETQNQEGSWGYYIPTAEETAYCLQALAIWKRHDGQVPTDVLKRGAVWLADHIEPPYPPLWIGKCLYCPVLVVRSAILSALELVTQECGQW
ncbi:MAG: hypothetical protein JW850_22950 [Thermoflexales bacterium]|nr:hypothetical protein [Thermoflexales bacterium]